MDDIFYSRIRLAIVAYLSERDWTSFSDLVELTKATRGNLSAHIEKLRTAGVIEERKAISNRRPLSSYRLTRYGEAAFVKHMREVKALFEAANREYGKAPPPRRSKRPKIGNLSR
jgi:DNA-binding transcriptional ArsR family regulator